MDKNNKFATGLLIISLVAVLFASGSLMAAERRIDSLQEQVEALQSERVDIDSLKAEMEDVKSVQGYVAWEQHWENRRDRVGQTGDN